MLTRASFAKFFGTQPSKGRRQLRESLQVVNNVAEQRFTITVQGENAVLEYEKENDEIVFASTDVPSMFQGRGFGKALAKHAFEHAQRNKLKVTLRCQFLAKYYEDNKQKFKDLKVKIDLE